MGINTAIRNDVLNSAKACSHAFMETPDFKMHNGVQIFDILTELFSAYNPETKGRYFTGLELYAFVRRLVTRSLESGECHTVVVCMDDPARVPPNKRHEQKKRDKAREVDPLPDCTEFCDGGFTLNSGMTPSRFDIKAVLVNRSLRPRLFGYLVECFKALLVLSNNTHRLVLDHFADGAWVHVNGTWGKDPTSQHRFGEADLSMMYWVNRLWQDPDRPASNFYIRSTDSDQLPLALQYLDQHYSRWNDEFGLVDADYKNLPYTDIRPPCQLWLRYWRGKKGERWMDMLMVYEYLVYEKQWPVKKFIIMCCLLGTDYTDPCMEQPGEAGKDPRRTLFQGVNVARVWEAMDMYGVDKRVLTAHTRIINMVYIVRAVYTYILTDVNRDARSAMGLDKETRQLYSDFLADRSDGNNNCSALRLKHLRSIHDCGKIRIPTDAELYRAFDQLQWNMKYWCVDWEAEREYIGIPTEEQLVSAVTSGLMDLPMIPPSDPYAPTQNGIHHDRDAEEPPQKRRKVM